MGLCARVTGVHLMTPPSILSTHHLGCPMTFMCAACSRAACRRDGRRSHRWLWRRWMAARCLASESEAPTHLGDNCGDAQVTIAWSVGNRCSSTRSQGPVLRSDRFAWLQPWFGGHLPSMLLIVRTLCMLVDRVRFYCAGEPV